MALPRERVRWEIARLEERRAELEHRLTQAWLRWSIFCGRYRKLGADCGNISTRRAGLAEHFGTRHLGTLRGTTSVFGIFGAATGPLLFAWWSAETGYVVFLASTAIALTLGATAVPRPFVRAEVGEAVTDGDMTIVIVIPSTSRFS